MNKYTLELSIASVYSVEVFAEDRDTAIDIAEDINPADDKRCSFLEARRDVTNEDEWSVTEALTTQTEFGWTIAPTGGGCYAIQTETELGLVNIATAEAQPPAHPHDIVTVTYSTNDDDTVLMTCQAHELFNTYKCAEINQLIRQQEELKLSCTTCNESTNDCRTASAETMKLINAMTALAKVVSEENAEHIHELLTAYRIHAISECNEGSLS